MTASEIGARGLELSEGERCLVVYWPLEGEEAGIYMAVPDKPTIKAVMNEPLASNGEGIIEQIMAIDEASPRLWENFSRHYPDIADHFKAMIQEGDLRVSMGYLLWCASALLWLSDDDIVTAQTLEKVGLKVDTVLGARDGVAVMETPKLLRSLISYKIAGVGNSTILFSMYESLADFIIDTAGQLNETFRSRVVVFLGDVASQPLVKDRLDHRMGRRSKLIWG